MAILKKILMGLAIAAGVLLVLEFILGKAGLQARAFRDDPYVGFADTLPLYIEQEAAGVTNMVTAPGKLPYFNPQQFTAQKATNTFRIFCVGGSVTHGRPYQDSTSFCGWLRELMTAADPGRNWELINAGGLSYASYRVCNVMAQLIDYKPDLFIVYSGHNEFLEERTYRNIRKFPRWVRDLGGLLSRTRVYEAVARIMGRGSRRLTVDIPADRRLPGEVETRLDNAIGPTDFSRDGERQADILEHYRANLDRMVTIARAGGAGILFVVPASNLRDCAPFKSEHKPELDDAAQERFAAALGAARQALGLQAHDDALEAADHAIAMDARHAHALYLRGQILDAMGRHDEAKASYARACDEDVCPLRALTSMADMVRDAAQRHGAAIVDFERMAERTSPQGIPGGNLFVDHVHPTVEGNRQLATALLKELERQETVCPTGEWDEQAAQAVRDRVMGGLDERAHGAAVRDLAKVLGWAGKFEEADKLAMRAAEMLPDDADAHDTVGVGLLRQGRLDEAAEALETALSLDAGHVPAAYHLGLVRHRQDRLDEAAAAYGKALAGDPDHADAVGKLALLYTEQGRMADAAAQYERLIALRPDLAEAHYNLGFVRMKSGDNDAAAAGYRRAIEINPGYASAHKNLGVVLTAQERLAEAAACFEEAVRLAPDDATARENLEAVRKALK